MSVWPFQYVRSLSLAACGLTLACGAPKQAEAPPRLSASDQDSSFAAPPIETVQAPITELRREEIEAAIEEGFPIFLQSFSTEPSLDEEGRFVGWAISRVHDHKKFEGLGIGAGDVIVAVNGLPLERPAQAYEAFVSLKSASSLDVEYLRGGRTMRLSLPIVGEPTKAAPVQKGPDAAEKKVESVEPASPSKKKILRSEG